MVIQPLTGNIEMEVLELILITPQVALRLRMTMLHEVPTKLY